MPQTDTFHLCFCCICYSYKNTKISISCTVYKTPLHFTSKININKCIYSQTPKHRPFFLRETALLVQWTNAQRRPRRTLSPPRPRTAFIECCLSPAGLFLHKKRHPTGCPFLRKTKARDGTRTRGLDLGKVALHQLSHSRIILSLSQ